MVSAGFVAAFLAWELSTGGGVSSPGVFPSPQGYGAGNWSGAYAKAKSMVASMTLEEMNNVTYGISSNYTGCVGVSGGAPRLGFPGFCLQDAGQGARDVDGVSAFASGISIGASWNSSLAYERGRFMGAEFKKKGVNVALGPVVGPVGRVAVNGRNWEGFVADPYANGIVGAQTVRGMQENVIASVKHFVAYEQETNRNPIGTTPSTSANLDDRTMHELYLWPFQDLVAAGAGCVMCSYNRINESYACENSKTINGLLKGELNFQGFVVSDWGGQHSGLPSANAGLDMAMPSSTFWDSDQLSKAVTAGQLNRTRLEDMATRIVAAWYQMGQDDPSYPRLGVGIPSDLLAVHEYVDARDPAGRQSLLNQAIEGHVLVKNTNNALPLSKPRVLSVFGYDAIQQTTFNPTPVNLAGQSLDTFTSNWQGINLNPLQLASLAGNKQPSNPPATFNGVLTVGGGSGSNTPQYISAPYDAILSRAIEDGTQVFSDFSSNSPNVISSSDACLVFINAFASESWDRTNLTDADSDILVNNVAAKCPNTIVIIHNAGIRLVDQFADNPNVTAIMFAHLPGQDAGRSVAAVLYGDESPSGRLPYTVGRNDSDYGDLLKPCVATDPLNPQCDFKEGVEIDYRSFLARNITPRYEFGYGLTYSNFTYINLAINTRPVSDNFSGGSNPVPTAPVYANGTTQNSPDQASTIGVGGLLGLYDSVGTISATITNIGNVTAQEVAQLYLRAPGVRTQALRGFQKVRLTAGQPTMVTFNLRRKDVSVWSTELQRWIIPQGDFQVFVGRSVLDVPLQGTFTAV